MIEIYVEDQKLDLFEGEIIESSHQINDIAELADQQVTFTNSFKIPITQNNEKIFGFAASTTNDSQKPFQKLETNVIRNGVQIIPKAQTIIERVSDVYELTIYSGAWKFFDATRRKFLTSLTLLDAAAGAEKFTWDRVTLRDKSELVGNEAKFLQFSVLQNGLTPLTGNVIDARNMYLLYSVQTIIDAILAEEGIISAGDLFTDSLYQRLAIPFSNKEYLSGEDASGEAFEASLDGQSLNDTAPITLIFETLESGNDNGAYSVTTGIFTATVAHNGVFTAAGRIRNSGTIPINVTIKIEASTAGTIASGTFNGIPGFGGTVDFSLTSDLTGIALSETVEVTSTASLFGSISMGTFSDVPSIGTIFGDDVRIAENLPRISRANLLKTVFQMFGAVAAFDPLTQTMTVNKFSILTDNIASAIDWSDKFDDSVEPEIEFRRDFAQENFLKYKPDNTVIDGLGDGSFVVNDDTLKAEKTEFTLPFAASAGETVLDNIPCAIVPTLKDDGAGGLELGALVQPRILLMVQGIGQSLDITDGSVTDTMLDGDWSRSVFVDAGESIGFDGTLGLIETKYPALVNSIEKGRRLVMNFNLNEIDIQTLNHFIPVFLDVSYKTRAYNGYFYVSIVKGFRGNAQSTPVNLIQL